MQFISPLFLQQLERKGIGKHLYFNELQVDY